MQYMGNTKDMHRKSDSLRKFSGNVEDFASWSQHVVDHMTKVHSYWKYTLNWMSTTEASLAYPDLRGQTLGPFGEDSTDLAIKFEQVLADWLPEKLYLRRDQLCGGKSEAGNGFTMWRRLHKDHVGDGEILEYAGTTVLREYGQCKKLSDVPSTLMAGMSYLISMGASLRMPIRSPEGCSWISSRQN